jgi:NADPH:quinone reductase-like Zn-dependent oxidoreductase
MCEITTTVGCPLCHSAKVVKNGEKSTGAQNFPVQGGCGKQLAEIAKLIESGAIKPVMDKVFPFEQTNEALAYVESGRSKGKVVIKLK